jgi:multisubunit Na+/H+ antiporter MnhB subunit
VKTALIRDGDRLIVPPLVLFALYLLAAGHNRPGGGFVAGLTVASAVVLRAQARGVGEAVAMLRLPPISLAAGGLLLAVTVGLAPMLAGEQFLAQPFVEQDWPLFGAVKLTAAFVFDIGVALLVLGVASAFVEAFDSDDDDPDADVPGPAPAGSGEPLIAPNRLSKDEDAP